MYFLTFLFCTLISFVTKLIFFILQITLEVYTITVFLIFKILQLSMSYTNIKTSKLSIYIIISISTFFDVVLVLLHQNSLQVRSLAQELSCRLPVDAFKGSHETHHGVGGLSGCTGICLGDPDIGDMTISEMNPEDIRAELKR